MTKLTVRLLLATSALTFSAAAQAQAASPATAPQAAADANTGLEEIVVTAQRRSENLMKVPLAISAQTGSMLQAAGIKELTAIRFNTPGFIASSGTGYTQVYIRGIGNGVFVGADPSIATFVDDVPHVYGSLVDDLVNIERVEILKGAQGGLYGRNASGGVINIITHQPGDELAGSVRLTAGERSTFQGSGYINVPFSDRVAANFATTYDYHGQYRKNRAYNMPYAGGAANPANTLATPKKLEYQNVIAVDGKIRAKLTDDIKVTLQGDYTNKHDSNGNGWLNTTPALTYGTYQFLAGLFGVTPVAQWPSLSKNDNSSYAAIPSHSYTKDYGGSAKIEASLEGVDLSSITAYRGNRSQFEGDIGAGAVPIAGFVTDFKRHFFYQELRAVSSGDGPFKWVGGATYFKDNIDASIASITLGFQAPPTTSTTNTTNYSFYGQGSYDFTDKLTFQASLRYAHEKKTVDFPATATTPTVVTAEGKVHKFIPAATLSYAVDGGTIYVRYAKGFKTGGPNPLVRPDRLPVGQQTGLILKPENVDTFEAGYRAQLFDRQVQFTSAIFYNKYKGIHTTTAGTAGNADISNALINLGNARTYGAEAAITWRVSSPFTLTLNAGYLNGKYKTANFVGNAFLAPVNASGNRMILAPKFQGGVQVNYDQPINDKYRIKANVLYSYISHFYFTALEQSTADQDHYSLMNLRVGVATIDDKVGLYLFANNVFDKRYYVFGATSSVGDFETPGNPRIIGGTVEVKF